MIVNNMNVKCFVQKFEINNNSVRNFGLGSVTESTDGERITVIQIVKVCIDGEYVVIEGIGMSVLK